MMWLQLQGCFWLFSPREEAPTAVEVASTAPAVAVPPLCDEDALLAAVRRSDALADDVREQVSLGSPTCADGFAAARLTFGDAMHGASVLLAHRDAGWVVLDLGPDIPCDEHLPAPICGALAPASR
ncbi:MAG: hypothetical protein R3F59_15880 [Myxococcota bacterium]